MMSPFIGRHRPPGGVTLGEPPGAPSAEALGLIYPKIPLFP